MNARALSSIFIGSFDTKITPYFLIKTEKINQTVGFFFLFKTLKIH
jgi:hypothetical protein